MIWVIGSSGQPFLADGDSRGCAPMGTATISDAEVDRIIGPTRAETECRAFIAARDRWLPTSPNWARWHNRAVRNLRARETPALCGCILPCTCPEDEAHAHGDARVCCKGAHCLCIAMPCAQHA